jgi:hypothetical protein
MKYVGRSSGSSHDALDAQAGWRDQRDGARGSRVENLHRHQRELLRAVVSSPALQRFRGNTDARDRSHHQSPCCRRARTHAAIRLRSCLGYGMPRPRRPSRATRRANARASRSFIEASPPPRGRDHVTTGHREDLPGNAAHVVSLVDGDRPYLAELLTAVRPRAHRDSRGQSRMLGVRRRVARDQPARSPCALHVTTAGQVPDPAPRRSE